MDFYKEADKMPLEWKSLAISLLQYAKTISNSNPKWENEQWVFRPENFVTFRLYYKRKNGITLYLRGTTDEFLDFDQKTLKDSVPGYSKIIIDEYNQAFEAFIAIRRAYQLYKKGRNRVKTTMKILE